jgi:hypothetical protein
VRNLRDPPLTAERIRTYAVAPQFWVYLGQRARTNGTLDENVLGRSLPAGRRRRSDD